MNADGLVKRLLESEHDNEDVRELIYTYLYTPQQEFNIGFAIGTSDGSLIEINAEELGIPGPLNWEEISEHCLLIERNALKVLNAIEGLHCRSEGHDGFGDLIGSATVQTMTKGFEVVHGFARMDEPYRTSSGTMWNIPGMTDEILFAGVPENTARIVDVTISFFNLDKFKEATDL